ncbi:TetR/AcrR family transcriptional regulator [Paenibacillus sp. MBLB4367]|uniref:TetR/AcrR family transcriptional regulator n=1 Tax=Paenibacillus sp. MBLB4367 TaxID=3384767 RepID=UPI0039081D00
MTDVRINRTPRSKEWIVTALFQLMEHQEYSAISILQIADKAGVVRQTFYRNYKEKDDVLFEYMTDRFKEFLGGFGANKELSLQLFVSLFDKWKQRSPSSLILNVHNRDRKIRQILFRSLDQCIEQFIEGASDPKDSKRRERSDDDRFYYARRSLSSVIHVMLVDWTLSGFRLPAEEMAHICYQLTSSMREEVYRAL